MRSVRNLKAAGRKVRHRARLRQPEIRGGHGARRGRRAQRRPAGSRVHGRIGEFRIDPQSFGVRDDRARQRRGETALSSTLRALQPPDHAAQEHLIEAQLTFGRHLLQQSGAHFHDHDVARGDDRGGTLGAAHVARLAEAVTAVQIAERLAEARHADASLNDDVEPIVHLAFLDDFLRVGVVLPAAGAQHLPNLAMRELVEELEFAQQAELLLLVDSVVLSAQFLVYAGQFGGEVEARFIALRRVLLQRYGRYVFQLLGNLGPQRVNGRWRGEHDLVQELLQIAGPKRPRSGEKLVHYGSQRIQIRAIGQFNRLYLFGGHVRRAAGDSLNARDFRIR